MDPATWSAIVDTLILTWLVVSWIIDNRRKNSL